MKRLFQNEWFILIGTLVLILGGLLLVGYLTNNFEGIASIGLIILAAVLLWKEGENWVENKNLTAVSLSVFAIAGIVFDGAGNFIYNKPIQYAFCSNETTLVRELDSFENADNEDVWYHKFSCWSPAEGKIVKEIWVGFSSGIRLLEYLIIGFILLGIYWLLSRFRIQKK